MAKWLCFLSCASALADPAADVGFENLFEDSLGEIYPEQCTTLKHLPSYVRGTYVTQSTYQYSMGGRTFESWLDAFWKLHTMHLRDGQVCYKTRRIRTKFYNNSVNEGTIAPGVLFMETKPARQCFFGGLCNIFGANDNNFAATYRMEDDSGGFKYALMTDTEIHLDFDLDSMAVMGNRKFSDHIKKYPTDMVKGGGTHLQCQAGKGDSSHDCAGDLYGVAFEAGTIRTQQHRVDLYRLTKGAPNVRQAVASVKVPFAPGSFHSFGLTDDYAILPLQPYSINQTHMMKGSDIMGSIVLEGNTTNIYLVNIHDGSLRTFVFDKPIYYVHVVNAWQNTSHVSFDVSAFAKPSFTFDDPAMVLPVLRNKTARDSSNNGQTIRRYSLDLTSGVVSETYLTNGPGYIDFPKVRSDLLGRPYCIYYGVEWKHNGKDYGSWALRKHNTCTGKVQFYYTPSSYVSEGQFVASGGPAEDDGVLILVQTCGITNKSTMVLLDAVSMESVEKFELPYVVGWYAHGAWYKDAATLVSTIV